ncbi:hypothetical protein [Pseudonocardia spirodelae]|uniref:Secreted protein n=1 Tax=Pseudonocardia spirodelae TaxID=3133431 RepID=A0ABU8TDU2_9PSEU
MDVRVLAPLTLLVLALVLCAGPLVVTSDTHAATPVVVVGSDCSQHPPVLMHPGDCDQAPRRDDDAPAPSVLPLAAVTVLAPGHPGVAPPAAPERTLCAPSPVEHLCVDRN